MQDLTTASAGPMSGADGTSCTAYKTTWLTARNAVRMHATVVVRILPASASLMDQDAIRAVAGLPRMVKCPTSRN